MSAGIVDTRRLAELEETIERGLATFIEVGTALAEVRDSRLYRAEHDTFEDYCRKRWQMDRVAAHRHIEAANVVAVLSKDNIEPPANLRQARELAPLRDDEAELVETWRELRAEHGQTLTASKIRHAVEMRLRTEALAARRPEHAVVPSFDGGTYPIIYADPPWRFNGIWGSRGVENHYPTMALEDICALEVPAAKDAALFLWSTASMQPEAFEVIAAWGFTYRTQFVWAKDRFGMGSYVRTQHEPLLIATRGAMPPPAAGDRPASLISAPRRAHSEKPEVVYGLIERMYPGAPRIELFARRGREGWAAWGAEAPEQVAA